MSGTVSRREVVVGAAALASLTSIAWSADKTHSTLATTVHGKVRGTVQDGIHSFKGIRYGADTGPRRFMPPLAPEPWKKPLDATRYGAASPQSGKETEPTSEDCLFLNVWTPGMRDGAKRPVMFYIHGGAYSHGSGSSPLYDGTRLCKRGDVVVVTVNHRLNSFGYLYLARLGGAQFADSGNAGMLDLVMALQWVRDNIKEFGGDPDRVLLFGQSGGGAKIATLMGMPVARNLFHRAVTMSGQQVTASGPLNATLRARAFLDALQRPVGEIAALPTEKIIAAMSATDPVIGKGGLYFGPVLDERTLQQHPFYPDAPAISKHIPMIIGNTHDETRLLIGGSDPKDFSLTWEQLPDKLASNMRVDLIPETVVTAYRKWYPEYSPSDVFFSATTAARSWRGAVIEVEARAAQRAPAYAYELDWKTPIDGRKWGAPHTLDIPLAFDNINAAGSLTGNSADAQKLADQVSETFIAFAKTGNPNNASIPTWEPYQLPRRQTMLFNTESRLADDPRGQEREFFAKVPWIQQGT
ncbi:MAG TPA: carboxylesterase/lipase family protein [Steroidobacteraceae bacterium]